MKKRTTLFLAWIILCCGNLIQGQARGEDRLDVETWLHAPGTRLLVVEFYSVHCVPCMKAVPRWKELYDRYRSKGFRFLVVSADVGACSKPDWTPDHVICDYEGQVQKDWNVKVLPQAFLWSWEGRLLVAGGTVDEVEAAVDNYYRHSPRILLDDPVDARGKPLERGAQLKALLRSELSRQAKFDLVADSEEVKRLRKIRKESFDAARDQKLASRLGREVSANSVLRSILVDTPKEQRLVLEMLSVEDGRVTASVTSEVRAEGIEAAVADGVTKLTLALAPQVVSPAGPRGQGSSSIIGDKEETWDLPDEDKTLVSFESTPPGAAVIFDGKPLCQATPCSRSVPIGSHTVELLLENYVPLKSREDLTGSSRTILKELSADFGTLSITTTPPGLEILVDQVSHGAGPIINLKLKPGVHEVLVSDLRYFDKGEKIRIERGRSLDLTYELLPREGGLEVRAVDQLGNELSGGEVLLDGHPVGRTPFRDKVITGPHQVRVEYQGIIWTSQVDIREKQLTSLTADMDLARKRAEEDAREQELRERKAREIAAADLKLASRTGWFVNAGFGFYLPHGGFVYDMFSLDLRYDWKNLGLKVIGIDLAMMGFDYQDQYPDIQDETFIDFPMSLSFLGLELHLNRSGFVEFVASAKPLVGINMGDQGVEYKDYRYINDTVHSISGTAFYLGAVAETGVRFNTDWYGKMMTHTLSFAGLFDNVLGSVFGLRYEIGWRLRN